MAHKVTMMGLIEGSIPAVASGGTGSTDDEYLIEVTTGGPSGTAEITIISDLEDDVAATAITSGAANNLGAAGATFTATFETLVVGDKWRVKTHATGEVDDPVALVSNSPGVFIPILVNASGELAVSAELEVGDIEIGAVELKDAATDSRASIEAANTARTTATKVLAVQGVDAAGNVLDTASLALESGGNLDTIAAVDFATESGGNLDTIAGDTTSIDGKLPDLGQALAAASVPVVLPAAQVTTLTPPAAITGFALEAGGNLADIAGYLDTTAQESSFGAQLTAVGWTDALNVEGNLHHTVVLTLGGTDDADLAVQWSIDGTNWYTAYSTNDSAAGVYQYQFDGLVKYVRIGFTAEHGTTSTLDGAYYGGR